MATSSPPLPRLTLDELTALSDELAALVRAGIPLERGLAALGGDLPGSLGHVARELARRGEQGESLEAAVGTMTSALPPVYRAVIQSGSRAGRRPEALQTLATASRRVAETRADVSSALAYPLVVALTAWGLLILFMAFVGPRLLAGMVEFGVPGAAALRSALRLGDLGWGVAVGVPVAIVAGAGWWLWMARRSMMMQSKWSGPFLGWFPWVGRMLRTMRAAVVCDLLAMLVECGVPLPESLRLAGSAAGDRRMREHAELLAGALERASAANLAKVVQPDGLPPVLLWALGSRQDRGRLAEALRHAGRSYHRRARHQADHARVFLPVVVTLAVGGTSTLIYAMIVFVPWIALLREIALS